MPTGRREVEAASYDIEEPGIPQPATYATAEFE